MMILKEIMHQGEGKEPIITEKAFGNKNEILKVLRRQSPLPSKNIYELSKYNATSLVLFGTQREFSIYNPETIERE